MACGKELIMKKRRTKIIMLLIGVAAFIVLDVYLMNKWGINLSYYERMLIVTGIPLIIASLFVAWFDEKNIQSRREDPIDYVTVKGFRVKESFCEMGEENLALLTLYNQSKRAATVTVKVTYLNVAGKVLGVESQTVYGMVRGMEKHLCFRPRRDFHAFTYTLETAFFRGVCHERAFRQSCFRVSPVCPDAPPRAGLCPIRMEVTEEYVETQAVEVICSYLLLDKDGRVYSLSTAEPRRLTQPLPARTFPAVEVDFPAEGSVPLEEELRERGVTGVCVYTVTPV